MKILTFNLNKAICIKLQFTLSNIDKAAKLNNLTLYLALILESSQFHGQLFLH